LLSIHASPAPDPAGAQTSAPRERPRLYLRLVGAYQIYGGIAGLDATLRASRAITSVAPTGLDMIGVVLWVATASLFAMLVYAGLALIRAWRGGREVTILAQALQSVMFGGAFGGMVFSAGLYSGLLLEGGRLSPMFGWALNAQVGIASSRTFIAINVVPLLIAVSVMVSARRERSVKPRPSIRRESADSRP